MLRKVIAISIFLFVSGCHDENPLPTVNSDSSTNEPSADTRELNSSFVTKLNLIENHTVKLKETLSGDGVWIQTCGPKILSNDDINGDTLKFTAPETPVDTSFCFTYHGKEGTTKYEQKAIVKVVAPTLQINIDHASLPTLQQLVQIIGDAKTNPNTMRLISWQRMKLSPELIKDLNAIFISGNHAEIEKQMIDSIIKFSSDYNRLNIELSTNTSHSYNNLMPILKTINQYSNITVKHIDLYDDGSLEYVSLYNWGKSFNDGNTYLQDLNDVSFELEANIKGGEDFPQSIIREFIDASPNISTKSVAAEYSWQNFYPTTYHFLRADYLNKDNKLQDFKTYLGDSAQQMKWNQYAQFSDSQKELFLKATGFSPEKMQELYNSSSNPNFVFTGTTTWGNRNKEYYAKQQINVINNAIFPSSPLYLGEDYDLFFKGHPRGGIVNTMIMDTFPNMENIDSKISFEVLQMTGMLPNAVGGISSSLYMTIPSNIVKFIVFTSSNSAQDMIQSSLVQVMLKLGIVESDKIIYWKDLPDCSSGVCVGGAL